MNHTSDSPPRWGMARKVTVTFALLIGMFGSASYFAVSGLVELHGALHQVEMDASRLHNVLRLASAVRDQYAHMAHTIIIGNDSHLMMYEEAARSVKDSLARVSFPSSAPDAGRLVDEIRLASLKLDELFRRQLLPAVQAVDRARAAALHEEILAVVSNAQEKAKQLSAISESSIAGFHAHAGAVQHRALRWVLILLASSVLCAGGIGLFLFRSVARPVASLAAGAARLGRGDLDTRIEIHSHDELGQLASQFNAMTVALKDHQARLVRTEKLAGIGRMAAGVAHEINNPLGVILGYVKLLRRRAENAMVDDLKIIEDEAERCREVVEDLLDLTRTPPLEMEAVDLRRLTEEVVKRIETATGKAQVIISIDGDASVVGSARKLRQVVHNLIKNAQEAVAEAGYVQVLIGRSMDGGATLSVADSGRGIPPEKRALVFEPFFTTKPTGTGMGLAVSRAIARAHGGELELAGEGAVAGTVFRLTLPPEAKEAA